VKRQCFSLFRINGSDLLRCKWSTFESTQTRVFGQLVIQASPPAAAFPFSCLFFLLVCPFLSQRLPVPFLLSPQHRRLCPACSLSLLHFSAYNSPPAHLRLLLLLLLLLVACRKREPRPCRQGCKLKEYLMLVRMRDPCLDSPPLLLDCNT
jgi:hypothetical protein